MKTIRLKVDPKHSAGLPKGRVDTRRLDATTEQDIASHQKADDADVLKDAAKFARRVRKRLGLTQLAFSRRIEVSLDTIRNWELRKRSPTGAAKAWLLVLDRVPKAALPALGGG